MHFTNLDAVSRLQSADVAVENSRHGPPDIVNAGHIAHHAEVAMSSRFLAAAGLAGLVAVQAPAADLTVEVRGIRSDDGRVLLAVHGPESKATFPSGDAVAAARREPARAGTLRFVINDLAPGRYALTAFHDENDNGDLDTNLLGIPREGYGFGNDAKATFGPPSFEAAAVTIGDTSAVAVMNVVY